MRSWLIAGVLLAGCPKKQAADATSVIDELRALAQPSSEVFYTRVNVAGPFDLPNVPMRETLQGPVFDGDRVLYDVISENAHTGRALDVTRVFYGPQGYGYLGTVHGDGTVQQWEPAQIVIPPGAKVGDTWAAEHRKGASLSVRSCEIMAPEACEDGIVVVCESKRDGGTIVLRDHFCRGVGWSGFEALVKVPSQPAVRMWSEGVVRDGKFAPTFETPDVMPPETIDPTLPVPPPEGPPDPG